MWRGFVNCQNCNTIIENGYALCTACELRFAGTLLRLARDEIGMIEVRGPNVFSGYWQMPEKTAAELRANGFFITNNGFEYAMILGLISAVLIIEGAGKLSLDRAIAR